MLKKSRVTWVVITAIVFCIVTAAFIYKRSNSHTPRIPAAVIVTPTTTLRVGKPLKILIPSIQLEATVEAVGIDKVGNMDTPKSWKNTAWYEPGPKPGERGSAVIDGHLDNEKGESAAFANLSKLKPGDEITIVDEYNTKRVFIITELQNYDLTNAPLERIFNDSKSIKLNLITCAGSWDKKKQLYSKRLVVYSEMKIQ